MLLLGKRYIVQNMIGQGGMGAVYCALDRLSGQTVALKRVIANTQDLIFNTQTGGMDLEVALANEFRLMASLRHPHIVSVLDYGFDAERQPFFTMEYLPDAKHVKVMRKAPLKDQITTLIQILQALAYLHRRGIVHSDLKSSNVLIQDGQARVLDFGLSIRTDSHRQGTGATGTLAYMAPEVLRGDPMSKSADLYALGIIAYQLLTGNHPFNTEHMGQLLQEVLYKPVDMQPLTIVHPLVAVVIMRLLEKEPSARYSEAEEVIAALSAAIQQPAPPETSAIRESFLQAATLVGRETEINHLDNLLEEARRGQGNILLIAGESGVGKSRLLDELRTLALVRGVLVLRGQSVHGGNMLYGLWRAALRWLALLVDITPEEAAILKPLIPDLEALLETSIPDAPSVSAQAAQARLYQTIESLFRRYTGADEQPILLILEDLHWASESLGILQHFQNLIREIPLLVIGSYRDDERPNLPESLPGVRVMKLDRLSENSIEDLSVSMLGVTGKNPELIRLLKHETEGNVFFLVEVIRALAEEAGQLDRISQLDLPAHVFVGGMQQIIQRRLEQVPPAARPLLQLAAVLGRQLDLVVLAFAEPEVDLAEWLTLCSNVAVLEVYEDNWRFTHEKLRDGILADLESAAPLHARAADALENASDPIELAPRLVYHWREAGNPHKAYEYALIAGDQAARNGVHREAKRFYEEALAALDQFMDTDDHKREFIDLALKLGRVSAFYLSENVPATSKRALAYAEALGDETRTAQVISNLGGLAYMRGNMAEAFGYFFRGIEKAEKLGLDELLVLPYNMVGRATIISGDLPKAVGMLERGIQLAEKYQDMELLTGSQAFMAGPYFYFGRVEEAYDLIQKSITRSETLGQPVRLAGNHMAAGFSHVMCGRFLQGENHLATALHLLEKTREPHQIYMLYGGLAHIRMREENYVEAQRLYDEALDIAASINIQTYVPMIAGWRAELALLVGAFADAQDRAEQSLATAEKVKQATGLADNHRVLGRIALAQGYFDSAEQHFQSSIQLHEQFQVHTMANITRLEVVKLHFARQQDAEARALLDELIQRYTELKMDWYLAQAQRMAAL